MPPKTDVLMKTGSNPKRSVCASGKESVAKAMKWRYLSPPSVVEYCWSRGESIVIVSAIVMMSSRCLHILKCYWVLVSQQAEYFSIGFVDK